MANELYSIEQVADLLGLHVRTVRGYVRSGRLPATRIGKQYRVTRADLEAFTGHAIAAAEPVRRSRHVDVSSVVQVDAISPEAASRATTLLMAATRGGGGDEQPLRIDTVYDEVWGRLKVIVTGSLGATVSVLRLLDVVTEPGR